MSFTIEWEDSGREPQCAADPNYPTGMDIDIARKSLPYCTCLLPYPAKRCGVYIVACQGCGYTVGVTTAGRSDDPKSLTINCLLKPERKIQ